MRRLLFLFFSLVCLLVLCSGMAQAQTTAITLQVTDTGSQSWNNGTWTATLMTPPGAVPAGPPFYQLGTSTPVPNQVQTGTLSATGGASITLSQNAFISPSRSQWSFLVCSQATATNNCYAQLVTITSATSVTLTPPALVVVPGPNSLAYASSEITGAVVGSTFYNLTLKSPQVCGAPSPCTWGSTNVPASSTVAGLPVGASVGTLVQVTDALTQGNCLTGGGAFLALCRWSGAAWQAIGDGGTAPTSAATISPLSPAYGGISDAIQIQPVDLSGGGTTLVSAGLFTASLVGKVGTCFLNNDFGSFGGVLFTVNSFTDASHIVVNTTITRSFASQICAFATQNFRTALNLAAAAVPNGGTLQLPCGAGMLISGSQIFSSFASIPSGGTINIAGCPIKGTMLLMDWSSMSTATTPAVSSPSSINVYMHDIYFTAISGLIGGYSFNTGAASSIQALITLGSGHMENVQVDNWQAASYSGSGAAITATNDGSTWRNVSGCAGTGLHVFDRNVYLLQDGTSNGPLCTLTLEGQEDGDVIVGGNWTTVVIRGNSSSNTTVNFTDVNASGASNAAACSTTTGTGVLNIIWKGGRCGGSGGGVINTNVTGLSNAGTNATFYAYGVGFGSSGTGVSINNAGSFWDYGAYPILTGASYYSGAGTWNGKTTLSGAAYTNATTSFTNVVGGSGQTFQWNVAANQFLNISCHLYYQAAATGGLNIEFTGPASPTVVHYGILLPTAAGVVTTAEADAYSASLGAVSTAGASNLDAFVSFGLQNGTTAGTINLLAKSSAAVTLTVQPGSYCQSN